MAKYKILLISTAHPANDQRIVGKIAHSLATDYAVTVALPHQKKDDFGAISLPRFKYVWARVLGCYPVLLFQFLRIRPKVVHIFMAELLPLAFVFRVLGSKIVYEVQENLYKKLPTKSWNKHWAIEQLFKFFDQQARCHFNFVFTEKSYLTQYQNLSKPWALVQNFASTHWLSMPLPMFEQPAFLYVGVISYERGLDVMLRAVDIVKQHYPQVRLHLVGNLLMGEEILLQDIDYQKVKENIVWHNFKPQSEAFTLAQNCLAGLAMLKPVGDYADSYPTKLFDYMALGLPVISSNFELYRGVIEPKKCGFCLSPTDEQALADAMIYLIKNPISAREMGLNGRYAVQIDYNWQSQAEVLKGLLQRILHDGLV